MNDKAGPAETDKAAPSWLELQIWSELHQEFGSAGIEDGFVKMVNTSTTRIMGLVREWAADVKPDHHHCLTAEQTIRLKIADGLIEQGLSGSDLRHEIAATAKTVLTGVVTVNATARVTFDNATEPVEVDEPEIPNWEQELLAGVAGREWRDRALAAEAELERIKPLTDAAAKSNIYERTYWNLQSALDEILGPREEDGAGQGSLADVWLVAEQRDAARAAAESMAPVVHLACRLASGARSSTAPRTPLFQEFIDGVQAYADREAARPAIAAGDITAQEVADAPVVDLTE